MKKPLLKTSSAVLLIVTLLSGCFIPNQTPGENPTTSGQDFLLTAQQAANATLTEQARLLPGLTATSMFTGTASLSPEPPATLTSSKPMVSVSKETNCRLGTDTSFTLVGSLKPGVMAEVVGMDTSRMYFYIRLPENPQSFCWLWGEFAITSGDITAVPLFTPMPTPTPAKTATPVPNFEVVGLKLDSCVGWTIQVKVKNTSGIAWSSGGVAAKDMVTSTTLTERTANQFEDWNGCLSASPIQSDLTNGESGSLHTWDFMYNPAGHEIQLTIRMCSADGMAGTCLLKTVNFTP